MGRNQSGVAATLSRKRAELATIETVDLPRLYRSIGKRVAALPKVPSSLAPHVESTRRLEATASLANEATTDAQRHEAYALLGQAAVDQFGEKAIPKNIAPELTRLKERRQGLAAEIAALDAQCRRRSPFARRLLWAAAGCVCLVGVSAAIWFSGVPSLGRGLGSVGGVLPANRQGDVPDVSASMEEVKKSLQIDRDAVRSFEKAVVAMAENVKAASTKGLDALREQDSVSAVQSGYDAVLAAWKKESRKFAAPVEKESLLNQLPFLADKAVRQEVLRGSQATLDEETERIARDLSEQVESHKQSADYAFGGLNDLGQRFERRAEERKQLINQGCSSLAAAFDNATTRMASKRIDAIRELTAKQERMFGDVKILLASLETELKETTQRLDTGSRAVLGEISSAVGSQDDVPQALVDKAESIQASLQALVDAEAKGVKDQAAASLRECSANAVKGMPPEALREKTRAAAVALSNRVEQSLAKLREGSKAERVALVNALRKHETQHSDVAATRDDSQEEAFAGREDTAREERVKTTPPAKPYEGDVDQAVLAVLGQTVSDYEEHGFAGVELGQTYDQLNAKELLPKYDPRFPWTFLSRDGAQRFVFDNKDILRAYSREYNGGFDVNGEEIIRTFGKPAGDTITRVFSSSQSRTNSEMLVYDCPRADAIVFVEFREARFLRYGQVDTVEKTVVWVLDQTWALPQLYRSASLKRPVLEWMQAAAERVASGSCNVDDLPLPPGTGVIVEGRGEKQVTAFLMDGGEGGRGRRRKQRRLGWVTCLSEELLPYAQAKPGTVGVEVDFGSYTCLESNELLKQHPSEDDSESEPADAIDEAPVLSLLNDEVTRQLLMEYFKPAAGKYSYKPDERGGVTIGNGRYEWKCAGILDGIFEVICNTNGSSGVYFLTKRGL
ncbi:MAG: hypothetical protein WCC69_06595 [Pirellulales bacterium]